MFWWYDVANTLYQDGAWVENKGIVLAFHHEAWKEKVEDYRHLIVKLITWTRTTKWFNQNTNQSNETVPENQQIIKSKGSIDPEKKEQLLGKARSLMQEVLIVPGLLGQQFWWSICDDGDDDGR